MNTKRSTSERSRLASVRLNWRRAFTLLELLIVIAIISILVGMMGVVIGNSVRKAREAATTALILKLDNMLDERAKGFDRATKSPDFQRIVTLRKQSLETAGVFGVSPKVIAAVARKDFYKTNFPQRYADFGAANLVASGALAGVPTAIITTPSLVPEDTNANGILDAGEDANGNGVLDGYIHAKHTAATESSALLYYMVTRMQVFGVPPVGESDFGTSEVRDTDGDGLMEFVDGWGRPLRFYRWPTRIFKPNGAFGADGVPGPVGGVSTLAAYGFIGTDDVSIGMPPPTVPYDMRTVAGLLIDGLPGKPALPTQQWDSLSEDPDDPYGLIATEIVRLFSTGTSVMVGATGYNEMNYPTLDTYHTPLIISAGADGQFGMYLPNLCEDLNGDGVLQGPEDTNGNGFLDYGVLAQPMHGPGGPYDFSTSAKSEDGSTGVFSALTDNITNRNRRAGKGK